MSATRKRHGRNGGAILNMIKQRTKDIPEYFVWQAMKKRCDGVDKRKIKSYHERGIRVCDRWLNSFSNFIADMGRRPSNNLSIDRINNDGNYEPSNCRWATPQQQQQNRQKRTPRCGSNSHRKGVNLYVSPLGESRCRVCAKLTQADHRARAKRAATGERTTIPDDYERDPCAPDRLGDA